MKIKVLPAKEGQRQRPCTHVNNEPVKPGDVVEVDRATARNLINKGYADPADAAAKELNLKTRSIVTKRMAAQRVDRVIAERKARAESEAEDMQAELNAA